MAGNLISEHILSVYPPQVVLGRLFYNVTILPHLYLSTGASKHLSAVAGIAFCVQQF